MQIDLRDINQIKPYEKNPRKNEGAIDAVAASLKEFGFRQPIVIDSGGVIIVGHTRWKAAQKLGLARVPVHVADLSPEKAKAYRLADNATNEIAAWDEELLPLELGELKALNVDLDLLGFDDEELARLMSGGVAQGMTDPDEVPLPPDEAVTQPGDLWVLGNHRLLCGDSAKADDVDRLLNGAMIHLVNTDPPYNVNVEPASGGADTGGQRPGKRPLRTPSWRSLEAQRSRGIKPPAAHPQEGPKKTMAKGRRLSNDFVSDEEFAQKLAAWFGNISRVLKPGRCFYLWGGYANIGNYPPALVANELHMSQCLIWVKGHPVITRKDFMGNHEWCFYGWRKGEGHEYFGPNNATDVWEVKKVNPQSMIHLTEKPVELAIRAMQYSSLAGENVLDLFGGSGSTLIAAEQTGRRAYLMELDALYSDVICERYFKFTGTDPVRERDGAKWSELKRKSSTAATTEAST